MKLDKVCGQSGLVQSNRLRVRQDNSGTIERDEFLSLPQVSSNPLATRMIAIFDEDGGGDVDFQEFVSGLSAFSSKGNKEEKLRFAFKVYDIDRDGYISNGELFIVLKMMVGSNLKDQQLQQIVDKTIMEADLDHDGKISFEEFQKMVENTDVSMSMTLGNRHPSFSKCRVLTYRRPILVPDVGNDTRMSIARRPARPETRDGTDEYIDDERHDVPLRVRLLALFQLRSNLLLPPMEHLRMICTRASDLVSFAQFFYDQPRQLRGHALRLNHLLSDLHIL